MGVDDIGTELPERPGDGSALAPVRPARHRERAGGYTGIRQRREERVGRLPTHDHRQHVHVVPVAAQPAPQHLHHSLETAELGGGDHVHDYHVPLKSVSTVHAPATRRPLGRDGARTRMPSRMTTAAASLGSWVRLTCAC